MVFNKAEYMKKYNKQYNINNRDKNKIVCKKSRTTHREEAAQYYQDNKEKLKQYYRDHPEVNLKAQKKYMSKIGESFHLKYNEMRYARDAWSKTVRKRDNNKCTWCNSTKTLVSHHIWHKAFCPESALDVDNGITLCHDCHMEQHRLDKL